MFNVNNEKYTTHENYEIINKNIFLTDTTDCFDSARIKGEYEIYQTSDRYI